MDEKDLEIERLRAELESALELNEKHLTRIKELEYSIEDKASTISKIVDNAWSVYESLRDLL